MANVLAKEMEALNRRIEDLNEEVENLKAEAEEAPPYEKEFDCVLRDILRFCDGCPFITSSACLKCDLHVWQNPARERFG